MVGSSKPHNNTRDPTHLHKGHCLSVAWMVPYDGSSSPCLHRVQTRARFVGFLSLFGSVHSCVVRAFSFRFRFTPQCTQKKPREITTRTWHATPIKCAEVGCSSLYLELHRLATAARRKSSGDHTCIGRYYTLCCHMQSHKRQAHMLERT